MKKLNPLIGATVCSWKIDRRHRSAVFQTPPSPRSTYFGSSFKHGSDGHELRLRSERNLPILPEGAPPSAAHLRQHAGEWCSAAGNDVQLYAAPDLLQRRDAPEFVSSVRHGHPYGLWAAQAVRAERPAAPGVPVPEENGWFRHGECRQGGSVRN